MNEIRDLMIGIDFGKDFSQICYYDRKAEEPRSLSMKVGTSQFEMPTCLCKRVEQGDYCVGLEAEYFAREKGGFLIGDLYELSGKTDMVQVAGEQKHTWELLAYFLKGMLKFLGVMDLVKNTKCLAVTMDSLDLVRVSNFKKACAHLGFADGQFMLLDHDESFYYYVLTQKRETWNRSVGWYTFDGNRVAFRKLIMNSASKPILVKLEPAVEATLSEDVSLKDDQFCAFIKQTLGTDLYSSVQMNGVGFDQEWAQKSVKLLCYQKRKVFFGNNLFARGACAAGVERLEKKALKGYRYMSNALVLCDVGMDMRMMGAPTYYSLIESGKNWYECKAECELILDNMEELIFVVSTMENPEKKRVSMALPGLPKRPNKTTRLSVKMEYVSPKDCTIIVKDLGFGEMFPGSGKIWKETTQW